MSTKVIAQNSSPPGVLIAHGQAESGIPLRMSLYGSLSSTHPVGHTITYEILTPPAGTFEDNPMYGNDIVLPNFIYYPPEDPGYGLDQFTFRIYDEELDEYSPPAIVNLRSGPPQAPMPDGRVGSVVKTDSNLAQIDIYSTKRYQDQLDIVKSYLNEEVTGVIQGNPFCDIWKDNGSGGFTEAWRYNVLFEDETEGWVDADKLILVSDNTGYVQSRDSINVAGNLLNVDGSVLCSYDIGWQFSTARSCGQYVDGTWWVVGPVTVTAITPNPSESTNGVNHGSMINPVPGGAHGLDSRAVFNPNYGATYDAALNAALNLPLVLAAGDVLISSQSEPSKPEACIRAVASLTVVSASPPEFSFRPSIYGTERGASWKESDVSYTRLRQIAPPGGQDLSTDYIGRLMSRGLPFFELIGHAFGQKVQGRANTADWGLTYGRAIAHKYGILVMWANCQRTQAEKRDVVVHLVQQGLDIYNYVLAHDVVPWISGSMPSPFFHDGGIKCGRKLPMVFAAVVLNDAAMLAKCLELDIFQEDTTIFEVSETDVGKPVWAPAPGTTQYNAYFVANPPLYVSATYTTEMIGTPEWGIRHGSEQFRTVNAQYPSDDSSAWNTPYRDVVSNGMLVAWGAATLMGIRAEWGNPTAFRYMLRSAFYGDGWWGGATYHDRTFQHGLCGLIPEALPAEWVGPNAGDPIPPGQEGGTFPVGMEPIPWATTSIHSFSSEQTAGGGAAASLAIHAIDGNPATSWATRWVHPYANPPHWIVIDLGSEKAITGLYYQPAAASNGIFYGNIQQFEVHVSNDAAAWGSPVSSGTWAADVDPKTVTFSATCRYVRLKAISGASAMANAVRIAILQAS